MNKVFLSPSKVIIGRDALGGLGELIKPFGKKAMLLAHPDDSDRVKDILEAGCAGAGVTLVNGAFQGECTYDEVRRAAGFLEEGVGCVVGLGGGKAIDTAKVLADKSGLPALCVPTIVSTDAPCSSMAVVYDENHNYVENYYMSRGPAAVLVDSTIIAKAPRRFLVAGIGDAYATCFEAEMCARTGAKNYGGGASTLAALELARLCRRVLLDNAEQALLALNVQAATEALENVIEANTLLSGIGFESMGLAAAHCMDTVLFILGAKGAMHGEQVAFGLLVQLVLENRPIGEIRETLDFYRKVGLPTSLREVGLDKDAITREGWAAAAEFAAQPYSTMRNMPFTITPGLLKSAVLCADQLGAL